MILPSVAMAEVVVEVSVCVSVGVIASTKNIIEISGNNRLG